MGCSFVAFLLAIRLVGRIGLREEGRERREREGEEELKSCWRWILLMRPKKWRLERKAAKDLKELFREDFRREKSWGLGRFASRWSCRVKFEGELSELNCPKHEQHIDFSLGLL